MSLFGSLMGDLDEDPIFRSHMRSMRQMNSMMNSIFSDPFGMMNPSFMGRNAITNSSNHPAIGHPGNGMLQMMPFGFPAMPGLNMEGLFSDFDNMGQGGNCHSFTSSSVMTMASGPDGRPQVYQETMSTTTAPGGVKETKKTVCDSRTGTKKMAIGHHIGERAHILEREQNVRSGEEEEREEFINLDEEEAESFNHEWKSRTQRAMGTGNPAICGRNYGVHGNSHNRSRADHRQLALPEPPAPSRQTKRLKWAPSPRSSIRSASPLIQGSSTTRSEALPSSTAKKVPPSSSSTTVSTGSRKREHTPDTSGGNKRHSTVDNSDST